MERMNVRIECRVRHACKKIIFMYKKRRRTKLKKMKKDKEESEGFEWVGSDKNIALLLVLLFPVIEVSRVLIVMQVTTIGGYGRIQIHGLFASNEKILPIVEVDLRWDSA